MEWQGKRSGFRLEKARCEARRSLCAVVWSVGLMRGQSSDLTYPF